MSIGMSESKAMLKLAQLKEWSVYGLLFLACTPGQREE